VIVSNVGGFIEESSCTGVVVGDGWVLTANHCTFDTHNKPMVGRNLRVLVGRDNRDAKDQGAAYGVASIYRASNVDVALLQLQGFDANRWHALPLAFENAVIADSSGVTLYGYGNTGWDKKGNQIGNGLLWKSPDGAFVRSSGCDAGSYICFHPTATTRTMHGDSGAGWLRWASGNWQVIAVHHGPTSPQLPTSPPANSLGTATLQTTGDGRTVLQWVRDTAALPVPPVNSIIRDSSTGTSYLVGSDRYRRGIPTGGDYNCFVAAGSRVINMARISIESVAERVGDQAICTPPSSGGGGGGTPTPVITLTQGATAAAGYWYGVVLSGFPAGSAVTLTCRDSVDPAGFWNQTFVINSAGQAADSTLCYSGDHPDHWVTAPGVESNHVTW
jgi:hypothetical protein